MWCTYTRHAHLHINAKNFHALCNPVYIYMELHAWAAHCTIPTCSTCTCVAGYTTQLELTFTEGASALSG